ncbi:RTA1 like protein-domain-containing protein [Armillaria novae-zelandiae]|uniref:RTA1 like protein-domain-containing protein n=1 Tax=Armillaria novae-zelandiae TaxID=153914 RepID=A0AA39P4F0_9AGAR|nr:RTA1 like protein-domain-containing protein [Armillaria novae-zelandiae]
MSLEHIEALAQMEAQDNDLYGYIPTKGITLMFIILFGISTLTHTVQGAYFRMWWTIPTILLGGSLEILGWSARFWSSISPRLDTPFTIQITATIIGPTPLVAANFIILGAIIRILGPAYSRLSPRAYSRIFISCDILALLTQAAGGSMASSNDDLNAVKIGSNVMLGGIAFQLGVIVFYAILGCEFLLRYSYDRPFTNRNTSSMTLSSPNTERGVIDKRLKYMIRALAFSTVCLTIRAIYRTIELADGWDGKVIHTQAYFNVFDGAMVILAIYSLNFAHPGCMIGRGMGKDRAIEEQKRESAVELAAAPN